MTASEFAFLALGLVLGIASGSALVVVLGSRPPAREVRLTVEHDAVPRRAATLSSDAFQAHGEPARGGPADRRRMDRDAPVADPPAPWPYPAAGVPVMASGGSALAGVGALPIRTTVPSVLLPTRPPAIGPATMIARPAATAVMVAAPDVIPVIPERDPTLDALRIRAVLEAERALRVDQPTATTILAARVIPATESAAADGLSPAETGDETPAIVRILRGDHRATIATVAVLAGADEAMRRPWQAAVLAFAEALIARSIERGILDFPVGNPFWDTFTTGQCREIAAALSTTGHRFDGIDGWADGRVPSYRDMTFAVAAVGLEPRRIRAWPTQEEIGALYREVTVSADDLLESPIDALSVPEVQELAGSRTVDLALLWRHWDMACPILAAPVAPATS
ncbi:MAG: hypothetical protein HW391_53 [Chloroflexi bacterium]|nr:hypothetical protein [Chloroflexota bacterium]